MADTPTNPQDDLAREKQEVEKIKEKISRGWLQMEREKSQLVAAIDNLALGLIMTDDQDNMTRHNPALEVILGKNPNGEKWTIVDMQKQIAGDFNLSHEIQKCIVGRRALDPEDIQFGQKKIRLFISPIIILKESLAVLGTVVLFEELKEK